MRVLLATLLLCHAVAGASVGLNLPCNKEMDGLLAADPDGNPGAFLSCQGVGIGTIGFWERKVCPNEMIFDFINQQCKTPKKKSRKQQTLNIAILNNSCASGETCIGGTVCDLDSLRCLCPYGTIPQMDTLSCVKREPSFLNTESPAFSFNSFGGYEKSPSGFAPNPSVNSNQGGNGFFQPNPNFKFNPNNNHNNNNQNYGNQNNFGNGNGYSAGSSQWKPNSYGAEGNGNGFQPNPSQKFIFQNFLTSTQTPVATKKVPILAQPGHSCRSNEICVGGSICTLPIGLCLCPGDLEARDGECVLPASAAIKITKVGIGALCSDLFECDHGSSCVMGRCACVSPLVQHEGKCALRQERKEVGPGELCDNGEVCIKGSVCDVIIPVCVCPPEVTDLIDGECRRVVQHQTTQSPRPQTYQPTVPYRPPATQTTQKYIPPTYATTQAPIRTAPVFSNYGQQQRQNNNNNNNNNNGGYQPTSPPYLPTSPVQSTFNYKALVTPAPVKYTQKPNHMKIQLGGSKQAGVGVRCSLNTDCMIGAYCNGNTNPPSCQCLSTHVNVEGRCEKVVYPGQIGCRTDMQCSAAYTGTACIDRVCVCPEGNKAVDQTCVPEFANPREECGTSSDGSLPACRGGSLCHLGHCVCPSPLVQAGNQCLPRNDNTCPMIACLPPLECHRNQCVCPDGVSCPLTNLTRTRRSLRIRRETGGLICWPGATTCSDGQGVCLDNHCHCLNGLVARDGKCRPEVLPVGSPCDPMATTPVCQEDSQCREGICTCRIVGGCQFGGLSRVEGACGGDIDCSMGYLCQGGRCICPDGRESKSGVCVASSDSVGAYKNLNSACSGLDRCEGGAICKENVCQCTDGAIENNARCLQSPSGRCSSGQSCGGGSICEFGVCRCLPGHVIDGVRCLLQLAEPLHSCQLGEKCVHGSVCRFGVCMCIARYMAIKGRCVRRESALQKDNVTRKPSIVTPPEEPVHAGEVKAPGAVCQENDQCIGGSKCLAGYCVCQDYEVIINQQCVSNQEQAVGIVDKLLIAAPGQSCEAKTNCTGGSMCIDRVCTCETGKIGEDGTCGSSSEPAAAPPKKSQSPHDPVPGSQCTLKMECPYRTECVKGVCRCKRGETIVDNTCRSAIHEVLPGGRCDPHRGYDCVGESHCIYGVCTCTRLLMNNGKQCVTAAEITMVKPGKKCSPERICGGGSKCTEGICRCKDDEVPDVNGKCVKKSTVYPVFSKHGTSSPALTTTEPTTEEYIPSLGEPCNTHCRDGVCLQNRCVPDPDSRFMGKIDEIEELEMEIKNNPRNTFSETTVNLPSLSVLFGHTCQNPSDCPSSAVCVDRQCRCLQGYRATAGYCDRVVPVGGVCMSTNQCEPDAFCLQGKCVCTSKDGATCAPPELTRPGEVCGSGKICSFNSYCGIMSGVCECPAGLITTRGECKHSAEMSGTACVTSRNCHRSSYCDNGFCLCKSDHELINGACLPPPRRLGNDIDEPEEEEEEPESRMRNNGPQAPMQERIRTESFMNIAPTFNSLGPVHSGSSLPLNFAPYSSAPATTTVPALPIDLMKPPFNYPSLPKYKVIYGPTHAPPTQPLMFSPPMQSFPLPFAKGASTKSGDTPLPPKFRVAMPGEFCGDGALCLGNAQCTGQFCRCPSGSAAENGICAQRKKYIPLKHLQHNDIAAVSYEESGEERQFAAPLENCQNFEYCTGGSECLNINGMGLLCQCPLNRIFLEDECVEVPKRTPLVGIGDACADGTICLGGSSCTRGVCVCGDRKREILGICVLTAQAGDDCSRGEVCVDGSICVGVERTCVCPPGRVSKGGRCVDDEMGLETKTSSNPGENCDSHAVCMDNSFCDGDGICQCLPKFGNIRGRCVPASMIRKPGEECVPGTLCGKGSRCTDGLCVCEKGETIIEGVCMRISNHIARKQPRSIKSPSCEGDDHCPLHFRCVEKLCVCHGSSSECLSMMLLSADSQCSESSQCPQDAECHEGLCICNDGFRMMGDACIRRRTVIVERSEEDITTIEPIEYIPIETDLPSLATPGSSCSPESNCSSPAICLEGSCVCSFEHLPLNDSCVPRDGHLLLGHRCSNVYGCRPGLVCVLSKCACKLGDNMCDPNEPVTSPPGGSCTEARECTGGSVCREGWCICPDPSMIVQKGICIQSGPRPTLPPRTVPVYTTASIPVYQTAAPVYQTVAPIPTQRPQVFNAIPQPQQQHGHKVTPGNQCGPLDSCVGGSMCVDGLCVCSAGSQPSQNGRCEAGAAPTYATQRPVPTSDSTWRTTKRPPAFIELPTHASLTHNNNECEAIGLFCRANTICINKSCQCPEGHILHNDGCVPPDETGKRKVRGKARHQGSPPEGTAVAVSQYSRPGEDCSDGQVCTGGSQCHPETSECACPLDKPLVKNEQCHPEERRMRNSGPGESCDDNTVCTNNSTCHSGQCRCSVGFVAVSGYCVSVPMATTPMMKTVRFAPPLASCDNGEQCDGGASCDEDTGICMCPKGQIVFGTQCQAPPPPRVPTTKTAQTTQERTTQHPLVQTSATNRPTTECLDDTNCGDGKICIGERCRCRPGTVDNGGICESLEALKPRLLKYGQPCAPHSDRCTNGAKCLDSVCKCPHGFALSPNGWCERFEYMPVGEIENYWRPSKPSRPSVFSALPNANGAVPAASAVPARPAWPSKNTNPSWPNPASPTAAPFYVTSKPDQPEDYSSERFPTPPVSLPPVPRPVPRPPVMTLPKVTSPLQTRPLDRPVQSHPRPMESPAPMAPQPRIRGRPAGATCRDRDICLSGSSCVDGRCACPDNHIIKNGHCVRAPKKLVSHPGDSCANGEPCVGGSICDFDSHKCICAARHDVVDGVCKSKESEHFVAPGASCSSGEVCSGGSDCVSGTCRCDENHYAEDGYCRHIASQSSQIQHEAGGSLRFSSKSFQPRPLAGQCQPANCRLPNCFCTETGRRAPLDAPIHDIPQFIVLTFDDAINGRTMPDYLSLFQNVKYRNPNGCPIKGTFFISHEWTNYDAVQWLVQQGMELASNSISHVSLAGENASRWLNEMDGQRRIMAKFGNALEEDIEGMRAPQLAAGGDEQFEMMMRAGFKWDNTLSANPGVNGEPFWPQTLDHTVPWNCHEENCPTSSFPGLWEVPLNQFYGTYLRQIDSYRRSSMVRAAVDLNNTVHDLTSMLWSNFDRAYSSNKAPFVLSLNADFLQLNAENNGMHALNRFLEEAMSNKDVFVVTMGQLVDWMRNPLPMSQIHLSEPLRCPNNPKKFSQNPSSGRHLSCSKPNKCMYRTPNLGSQEHQFLTCSPCPDTYPWLENPIGNSP